MGIFDGNGRKKIKPVNVPHGTRPVAVTAEEGRRMIAMEGDDEVGPMHSASGSTVWIIVTHYLEQGIPHIVQAHERHGHVVGYTVNRTKGA